MSFESIIEEKKLLKAIYEYGWEKPSEIQEEGISKIMSNKDCMIQAQSGTGKTGTFCIGILASLDYKSPTIQSVILAPTRELANQIYIVCRNLAKYLEVNIVKCIGKLRVQKYLKNGKYPTILIGTPGKMEAVLTNQIIEADYDVKHFIIDEFDEMLKDNFKITIYNILKYVNEFAQIILISATTNDVVLEISKKIFRDDHITISKKTDELTLEGIRQYKVDCDRSDYKFLTIIDLYQALIVSQSIIFVNSKRQCDLLQEKFENEDFTIASIHGGMEQQDRDQVMDDFRNSKVRILLSTDLTARGIDVHQVSLVINYDIPRDKAQYIHRIGRCGRYGKKGAAITLIAGYREKKMLEELADYYDTDIPELPSNFAELLK